MAFEYTEDNSSLHMSGGKVKTIIRSSALKSSLSKRGLKRFYLFPKISQFLGFTNHRYPVELVVPVIH